MPDKCWCAKERKAPLIAGWRGPPKKDYICPDHGESWRWRPCKHGRSCHSSPDDSIRECRVRGHMVVLVNRRDCASCPIPEQARKADVWDTCGDLLVGAVRFADLYYGGGVEANYPSRRFRSVIDAALVAAEKHTTSPKEGER